MRRMPETPILVVGTAGHIDHGKSRLVLALTGTDPDRLPEEQARGMTIDLGFAHLSCDGCELSFVDVPGHERFIRNMVAGATGIDVALLVVAADDSVMPQTREHAELLSLLGVQRCLLVLTKMDLVDEEWADQVEDEARGLLAAVGIQPLACVRTSAQTGRGLDEIRRVLVGLARDAQRRHAPYRWFRMPIDRVFVVAGRGTVATGSVAHGTVQRDAELDLWPAGKRVRVRDMQMHHDQRATATGRMRLGLNLAAVPTDEVRRGCELASPGYLRPTRWMDVWMATVRMPGKVRRQTLHLRLHIATSDVLAELRLLAEPEADACRSVLGQLKVAQPIVATWGQHFIVRDESATHTLGGGRVLRPAARRWTARHPPDEAGLRALLEGAPRERLAEIIRESTWQGLADARLAAEAGLADAEDAARLCRSLLDKGILCQLETASQRLLVHASHLKSLGKDLVRRLRAYLEANPRIPGVPRSEWLGWMPRICPERFRPALADWFIAQEAVVLAGDRVVPPGHRDALAPADQTLYDQMLAEFDAGAFQPPDVATLRCRTPRNDKRLRELIDLAVAHGHLVRIADGLWLHTRRWDELVVRVSAALRSGARLTVADIRTLLNSSRKFVVPIAERLDATGVTRRAGDYRELGAKAPPAGV
jgi:selenocysteine-specific elongation factor